MAPSNGWESIPPRLLANPESLPMPETFSSAEYSLYGRQMILPELGMAGQERLKSSHAIVIGAGGLGAPALLYLAGAGVGTITVIDDDEVEISNLHRQVIHTYSRVGNSKAGSAADTLRSLNPFIEVRTVRERLSTKNADILFSTADVVLDGSDNFETRYIASAACARAGIAHVWAAILGFDAQMSVFFSGHGPIYEDLYPFQPAPGTVPTCSTEGVMGALAGVVGTSMAMEALKILAGIGKPLIGEVGYYSGLEGRWEYIPLRAQLGETFSASGEKPEAAKGKNESKLINGHNRSESFVSTDTEQIKQLNWEEFVTLQKSHNALLIDVREPAEYLALKVPGALSLPFTSLAKMQETGELKDYISAELGDFQTPLAFYCTGGPRASEAAQIFATCGVREVFDVRGGIAQWLNRKI